jgi:hypothetical protein
VSGFVLGFHVRFLGLFLSVFEQALKKPGMDAAVRNKTTAAVFLRNELRVIASIILTLITDFFFPGKAFVKQTVISLPAVIETDYSIHSAKSNYNY